MCQQVCIGELHLAAEKSKSLLCKGQPPELSGACSGGGGCNSAGLDCNAGVPDCLRDEHVAPLEQW